MGRLEDNVAIVAFLCELVDPEVVECIVESDLCTVEEDGIDGEWHCEGVPACSVFCLGEGVGVGCCISPERSREIVGLVVDEVDVVGVFAMHEVVVDKSCWRFHVLTKGVDGVGVFVSRHSRYPLAAIGQDAAEGGGCGQRRFVLFTGQCAVVFPASDTGFDRPASKVPNAAIAERAVLIAIVCGKVVLVVLAEPVELEVDGSDFSTHDINVVGVGRATPS